MKQSATPTENALANAKASQRILEALQGIRYGAIEITVHDGRIVQIERKEKFRLDVNGSANSGDPPETR